MLNSLPQPRILWLAAVGLIVFELGIPSAAAQPAAQLQPAPLKNLGTRKQGVDWPSFLGPTGDSKSSETGILTDWQKSPLRLVWQRRLSESYCMPAIAAGRCVLFDRIKDRATVICVESETGKELWNFDYATGYRDNFGYDNGPRCAPVIDEDRVYTFGADGMLHCLSLVDGKVIWELDTAKKFNVVQNFFGVGSTPLIAGELLIAQIGGSPAGQSIDDPQRLDLVRGDTSGVVAFDKRTGKIAYQFSDELASYASPVIAAIGERSWGFVFARGGLIGFDPTTGKQDFHFPWRAKDLFSANASNPVVVGDKVLISECYGPGSALLKVKPGGYDVIWQDPANIRQPRALQTHWNTPIHHNGYVYGSSGRHNSADLRCIELATGKVRWSQQGLGRSSLLLVDGHFICLNEVCDLVLLKATPEKFDAVSVTAPQDAQTGERYLNYPAWAAPILSHGLLYLRGRDRLICLELIPEKS